MDNNLSFIQPQDAWDRLSMREKAEMMKVAVRNGITSLSDIRDKYNEYAEGGNLFKGGGNTVVTDDLVDWTIREEGFNRQPEDIGDGKMTLGSGLTAKRWHNLYKKRGNKWSDADNRMAVRQELSEREAWARNNVPNWKSLPDSSKEALLLYKYNYDFNQANSPKLFAALAAGNLQEAARQMDATSKDPKFRKGLMDRRKREQEHFLLGVNPTPSLPVQAPRRDITVEYPVSTSVFNPFAIQASNTQMMPIMVPDEGSYVTTHEESPSEQRAESIKNRFDAINRFNVLMDLISSQNNPVPEFMPTTGNSFLDALGLFANSNARGGKIHIAPSKRGTFTAAAKKHGKSVQAFASQVLAHPENYSPAMRKKANFARNAAKWHGLGGNLFSGEEDHSSQMITTGGAGYIPPTSSSDFLHNTILNLSSNIMTGIHNWGDDGYISTSSNRPEEQNGGIAQRTFLAGRKIQEEEFKKHGFIKDTSGDYGLVKKEVGNNKYPIWQRTPDEISRDKLIAIGNTYDGFTGIPRNKAIIHGGSYPTAYYVDPSTVGFDFESEKEKTPKFYAKSWDLNDYGGEGGSTAGIFGKALDFIGSPVVQTTGYIDITDSRLKKVDNMLEDYLYEKGLVKHRLDANNPYGSYFYGLPEITIRGKKRKALGGNLFDDTTEDSQQMDVSPNIFRRPDGTYFYQAYPDSKEITVTPRLQVTDDPASWTYTDENGKLYRPKQTATPTQGEVLQGEAPSTWENILNVSNSNYTNPVLGAPARWRASWSNDTNPIKALWDNPVMYAHPYTMAAKTIENLTGREGLQKTWNLYKNSDGSDNDRWLWQRSLAGDAAEAFGLLPLIQASKPAINTINNVYLDLAEKYPGLSQYPRYAIGKFKYGFDAELPTLYRKMKNGAIPVADERGNISLTKTPSRFRYKSTGEDPMITNFTTDVPVRSHPFGHWEEGDVLALNGKTLLGHKVISTRPSDTFTVGSVVKAPVNKTTYITGDANAAAKAKATGYKVHSPQRLQNDYMNADDAVRNAFKLAKREDFFKGYENSIEQETRGLFKAPTAKDYAFMDYVFKPVYRSEAEPLTNLASYRASGMMTAPVWLRQIAGKNDYQWQGINHLNGDVLYHPFTDVEAKWRKANDIELLKKIPQNIRDSWKK